MGLSLYQKLEVKGIFFSPHPKHKKWFIHLSKYLCTEILHKPVQRRLTGHLSHIIRGGLHRIQSQQDIISQLFYVLNNSLKH